jgi:hypothetical protein
LRTFASSVDKHSSVHAFNGDEILSALLVFVLVSEDNLGKGGTSAGVMDDVSHNSLHIPKKKGWQQSHDGAFGQTFGQLFVQARFLICYLPSSLSIVEGSEAGGGDSLTGVCLEDRRRPVTLGYWRVSTKAQAYL